MLLDELVVALGFDFKGEGDLRKFKNGLDGAERQAQGFATAVGKMGLAITGAFAAIGGAAALGGAATGLVRSITDTGAQFEGMAVQLKALEGSSEGAEKAMAWITEFAKKTPLELADVVDSYALMRTYGLDPMSGAMQSVTDAMAATGGGAEKLNGIITGLGQAWTKQKLQGEEIMQLLERGIPVWDMLSQSTGKSVQELQKLSSAGKLGRREIGLLIDQIGEKYKGASEDYSKTWAGITSNLADNWTQFLKSVADAGYFDDAKRRLRGFLDWVNRAWENGTADLAAQRVSDALVGAMNFGTHVATQMYRVGSSFYYAADAILSMTSRITGLSKSWAAAGIGAGLLASSAGGRALVMAAARRIPQIAALLAIDDIISGLNGDKSLVGSTEAGQAALDRLQGRFDDLKTAWADLGDTFAGVRERMEQALGGSFDLSALDTAFGYVGDRVEEVFNRIQKLFTDPSGFFADRLAEAVNALATGVELLAGYFERLSALIENPKQAIAGFVDEVIAQLDRLVAAVDAKLGGALTKMGILGQPTAQANPNAGKVRKGGAVSAPRQQSTYTPTADLVQSGMQQAEALVGEYGVSREKVDGLIESLGRLNGIQSTAEAILKTTGFMEPANQVKRMLDSINGTYTANVDVNLSRAEAKLNAFEERLRNFNSASAGAGRGVVTRPGVAASPATP